jgi:hypothetical protein
MSEPRTDSIRIADVLRQRKSTTFEIHHELANRPLATILMCGILVFSGHGTGLMASIDPAYSSPGNSMDQKW